MNDAVKNEKAGETKNQNGFDTDVIIIGAVVLGLAALIAYQFLACATCYGASWL